MGFISLSFYNYRNLENNTIDLLSKEVYFIGKNGQGKSNLLESIYFCSYGNSFRTRNDEELLKIGQDEFSVRAFLKDTNNNNHTIQVNYKKNKKNILKNGKSLKDRKEMIETMPCILFCHEDMNFVIGEPERRRFFIDQSLSLYDVFYIDTNRRYKKILKSRNSILKEKNYDMLNTYNQQLVLEGIEIQKKRKDAVFQFNQFFSKLYEEVSGIKDVSIVYNSSWKSNDYSEVLEKLIEKTELDKTMCTTMSGPHRDKIVFARNGENFVSFASTGQRRLLALLLRIAQAIFYKRMTGKNPIFLMDDVLLELDPEKRKKITEILPEYEQLFCTFLPEEPYQRYMKEGTKIYFIENGSWHE